MSTEEVFGRQGRPYIDPYKLGRGYAAARAKRGPASSRVITGYGFWIFLLSDIIMFSCYFAAFAVLRTATAGVRPERTCSRLGALQRRRRFSSHQASFAGWRLWQPPPATIFGPRPSCW